MNYSKIVLVGFISAFVAVLTSILGVAGTVIGSVISSVLYNMLSEALEEPVSSVASKTKHNFEWDIAYVFPIVVIALIQLLLICSFLSEWGILPTGFLNFYLSLQKFAENNLYKILGLALLVISIYPLVLKPEHVKKVHGVILAFVGLVFLARGFVDIDNRVTDLYDQIFVAFDFPIAVVAFILLAIVIVRILMSARDSDDEIKQTSRRVSGGIPESDNTKHRKKTDFKPTQKRTVGSKKKSPARDVEKHSKDDSPKSRIGKFSNELSNKEDILQEKAEIKEDSNENVVDNHEHEPKKTSESIRLESDDSTNDEVIDKSKHRINKSSENIQFESNDLLDDYKK